MKVVALLPLNQERDKYLLTHNGESIIQNVINYTKRLNFVEKVVLITDDNFFEKYSDQVDEIFYLRKSDCRSDSERVYKYYRKNSAFSHYVLIPTLDPSINSEEINKSWSYIERFIEPEGVATFYSEFNKDSDIRNMKFIKLVTDEDNVLYFSRSPIPIKKNGSLGEMKNYKKNVEIFVFPNKLLKYLGEELWGEWNSILSDIEELQQNRFLEFGLPVYAHKIEHKGFSVESMEDIDVLKQRLSNQ